MGISASPQPYPWLDDAGSGLHIDPETGLHAVIDHNDNLSWFSPRSGSTAAHKHWVHDDWSLPPTKTYNPTDEAAQRANMFNITPVDRY